MSSVSSLMTHHWLLHHQWRLYHHCRLYYHWLLYDHWLLYLHWLLYQHWLLSHCMFPHNFSSSHIAFYLITVFCISLKNVLLGTAVLMCVFCLITEDCLPYHYYCLHYQLIMSCIITDVFIFVYYQWISSMFSAYLCVFCLIIFFCLIAVFFLITILCLIAVECLTSLVCLIL